MGSVVEEEEASHFRFSVLTSTESGADGIRPLAMLEVRLACGSAAMSQYASGVATPSRASVIPATPENRSMLGRGPVWWAVRAVRVVRVVRVVRGTGIDFIHCWFSF